jgi:hypothetical protein
MPTKVQPSTAEVTLSGLPKFFNDFKRIVESTLRSIRRLSLRHFIEQYDYDDFLETEARECKSPRALAIAFAVRFLDAVPTDYGQALSMGLVTFLSECCGRRQIDATDIDAIKTLIALPTKDEEQIGKWLDAYFRDVL